MIEISLCSSLPPPQQLPFSFWVFFSSSLLFPSAVGCQPGPRRKSKLKRQMQAVTWQGWGGTERAALPRGHRDERLPGTREPPARWGHGGDALFLQHGRKASILRREKKLFHPLCALQRWQRGSRMFSDSHSGDSVVTAFGTGYIRV